MKTLYLAAATVGAIVPYLFFFEHFGANGLNLLTFLVAVFTNPAASGFTVDRLKSQPKADIKPFDQPRAAT